MADGRRDSARVSEGPPERDFQQGVGTYTFKVWWKQPHGILNKKWENNSKLDSQPIFKTNTASKRNRNFRESLINT